MRNLVIDKLRNMSQSLEIIIELDKGAEIGGSHNDSLDNLTRFEFLFYRIPGIREYVPSTETDPLLFLVDLEDLDLDDFPFLHDLRRMFDPAEAHFRDMQKALNSTDVDKSAVICEFDNLTLGDRTA